MNKLCVVFLKLIFFSLFSFSCLIILAHFYFISTGFYFSGDTISNFEPAYPGKVGDFLSVFQWSYSSWPPALTFIFHTLRFLPISIISQHQLFVVIISSLTVITSFLIANKITNSKIWQVVFIALILFTGAQSFLFTTALSESLLILVWLITLYFIELFFSTKKERYLLLFILSGSLIPLSRYLGAWVLLSFSLALIFFTFTSWKNELLRSLLRSIPSGKFFSNHSSPQQSCEVFWFKNKKKYSLSLVIISLYLVWTPILIYLFRNYLLSPNIFGGISMSIVPKLQRFDVALTSFLPNVLTDTWIYIIAGVILGTQFVWKQTTKNILGLSLISVVFYYIGLAIIFTKFIASETFHSRYLAVSYPTLTIFAVCFGSYLSNKFSRKFLKYSQFSFLALFFIIYVFLDQLIISVSKYKQEIQSNQGILQGVEHSSDIRGLCTTQNTSRYLFLQESSRNWIGQALGFYCQPINIIPSNLEIFKLPKDAHLLTPYKLNESGLNLQIEYSGNKEMRLYKAVDETNLNIRQEFQRQVPLDWFSELDIRKLVNSDVSENVFLEFKDWKSLETKELGFSTKVPLNWQVYSVPHRGGIFLTSNIPMGDKSNKEFYTVSVQKITLDQSQILEDLYFPDKFLVKEKGSYLIYTARELSRQKHMLAIFVSNDGKNFIRYSLAPYSKQEPFEKQKRVEEILNKIVDQTKIF